MEKLRRGRSSSGGLDRIDSTEDYSGSMMKWVEFNSASKNGFAVPVQLIQLTKLRSVERRRLVRRLTRELEQTRVTEKKFDSRNIKLVNVQQKGLQVCNMKKSPDIRQKRGGWTRHSITGKFQSANRCVREDPKTGVLKQCESLLKRLMSHKSGWVFNTPVDVVGLNIPDYFDIVKNPMDLGTIKTKLSSGKGYSPLDFLRDIRLTFMNAKTYNLPGDKVHIMADNLSQFFESRWKDIEKNLVMSGSQSLPEISRICEETTTMNKPIVHPKKRKLSPSQYEVVVDEPERPKVKYEEKQKLISDMEDLLADLPNNIVEFLKAQSSNAGDGGEDEIEIDIDELSDGMFLTLRKLFDDHLKQEKLTNSGACEIVLPNVSCLSNFSSQVDEENSSVDEDVDIGGDETPVTSCPPIEIDKDVEERAEERTEAACDIELPNVSCLSSSSLQVNGENGSVDEDVDIGGDETPVTSCPIDIDKDVEERAEECTKAASVSGLDQLEHGSQLKQYSSDSDGHQAGESELTERQVSPYKQDRAAFLKSRFSDTILKAREKTLPQAVKRVPEKLKREREKLEMHKKREKARLQAEAKAAEDARKLAEAEAAAEGKKRRDLERQAAREALLEMEKTAEINDNSMVIRDLAMLSYAQPLLMTVDETSPDPSPNGLSSFSFSGSNPLEQLGLYMKEDDEMEEDESPSVVLSEDDLEDGQIL